MSEITTLIDLWSAVGAAEITAYPITVERSFKDIDEYWNISSLFPNIQEIVPGLKGQEIKELKQRLEESLERGSSGQLIQKATANAIKGIVVKS